MVQEEIAACRTNLLSDEPAQTDSFGPHTRVAKAIAEMINGEEGGKSIALAGPWGSGKSSVVRFMKPELKEGVEVFVFDAWAHQGDPLRRTFLERLIAFLQAKAWLQTPEGWRRKSEELARRLQITTTTSESRVTSWGAAFGTSALLVPLGFQLFSKYAELGGTEISPLATLGVILSLSPLIVFLLAWLSWRPNVRPLQKAFWTTHKRGHEEDSLLALFLNKTDQTTRQHTTHTPDPTSVEFQGIFCDLLRDALGEPDRKLVIVIDNLDRVDPSDALSIWATMRTFLEAGDQPPGTHSGELWRAQLWLLVPYDPTALKRLWSRPDIAANLIDDLVQSFVEKSFQSTFRVPLPVLSEWQDFLKNRLKDAFPNHRDEDFHSIYRIYSLKGLSDGRPPTPRELKLFINRVGAVHRQWQDGLPLPLQALYVLVERKYGSLEKEIVQQAASVISPVPPDLLGQDWLEGLLAIHFNVEKEQAIQVAIGGRVEAALVGGNGVTLEPIQHVPGFTEVCEELIERNWQRWSENEPRTIALAAFALSTLSTGEVPSWKGIWKRLCNASKSVKAWPALDAHTGQGLAELVRRRQGDEEVADRLSAAAAAVPPAVGEGEPPFDPTIVGGWIDGVTTVLKEVLSARPEALSSFSVPGNARIYLGVLMGLSQRSDLRGLSEHFKPKAAAADVVSELARIVSAGRFEEQYAEAIDWMLLSREKWVWTNLVSQLAARLQASNNLPPKELRGCILGLLVLAKADSQARETLLGLAQQGHLAHQFYHTQADSRAIALSVFAMLESTPALAPRSLPGNGAAGMSTLNQTLSNPAGASPKFLDELVELVLRFDRVTRLYEVPQETPAARAFVGALLDRIVRRPDVLSLVLPAQIVGQYGFLETTITPESLERLVTDGMKSGSLGAAIRERTFDSRLVALYRRAFDVTREQPNLEFVDFIVQGLSQLAATVWKEQLGAEGPVLDLVISLQDAGYSPGLSRHFGDALLGHAERIMSNGSTASRLAGRWGSLVKAMNQSTRKTFLRDLRDRIAAFDGSVARILSLLGDELVDCEVLGDRSDDLVRSLFRGFLERLEQIELKWLFKVLSDCPDVLDSCYKETLADFKERLAGAIGAKAGDEETVRVLQSIADLAAA